MKNIKRITQIFKIFSNINRVKIVHLLSKKRMMNVTDLAEALEISFTSTSKHLIILERFDVVSSTGKLGHVFYSLSEDIPNDVREVMNLFT